MKLQWKIFIAIFYEILAHWKFEKDAKSHNFGNDKNELDKVSDSYKVANLLSFQNISIVFMWLHPAKSNFKNGDAQEEFRDFSFMYGN